MSLYINHNLMAANAARNLSNIYSNLSTSVQRLSSGLRINSAADDAAGLAVRELMRADIAVINQGIRNASDAISMIQTAEGAMSVIDEKLIRMKELAEQAATGTYTTAQRLIMDSEYQAMAAEIDRIASATDFNGIKLLDGSMATQHDGSGLKVHFGTGNDAAEDYYFVSIGDMKATSITGLQVGGSGVPGNADGTMWTTNLDLTSRTDPFVGNNTGFGGIFGIQTSTDGTTWDTYGFSAQPQGTLSLDNIVDNINTGNSGTNTIDLSSVSSADLNGRTITIDSVVYTFSTAVAFDSGYYGNAVTIGIQGSSLQDIAESFAWAQGIHAVLSGNDENIASSVSTLGGNTVITLYDGFGASSVGALSTTCSTITLGGAGFSGGGTDTSLVAEAVQDSGGNWELRLTSNNDEYIRLVGNVNTVYQASSSGDSTTPESSTNSYMYVTNISPSQLLADTGNWILGDEVEWDGADILTQSAAQLALAQIDDAINRKDTARASLGALQNRLENTITNLQIQAENLQASESRISDVDVALEMTEFTRNNIMTQAAVSMLAQANSLPQLALQLLG